jgi:multiple sugar transport system substrate-binding protein
VDFDGVSIKIKPLTNEEIDTYKKMIENSKGIWEPDKKVLDIVKEEAAAYFAGDKSVDDVCKVIQDRVTTYVNESK